MSIDIYPTLHFRARPDLTPSLLTFTRTGTATRIDGRGFVRDVAADALRHDFDPVSGAYKGWLIEEGRTNLLLHSRDLTQGVWTKTGMSVARDAVGMDGLSNTGCTLTATLADATVHQAVTATSAAYSAAVDLKRVTGTGAVSLSLDGGATWTDVTAQLRTDRFTRVSVTQTLANPSAVVKLATAGDVVVADYAQLEAGSFPTSRIPTGSATAGRGADIARAATSAGWFNPDEGTIYVEATIGAPGTANKAFVTSRDDPDAVEFSVNDPAAGIATNMGALGSGFSGGSPSNVAIGLNSPVRAALVYAPGGGGIFHGGTKFQSWSSGKRWDTGELGFGVQLRGGAQRFLNGWIRHVAVFPRRLSDAQVAEIMAL